MRGGAEEKVLTPEEIRLRANQEAALEKIQSLEEILPGASRKVHDAFFKLSQRMVNTAEAIRSLDQLLPGMKGPEFSNQSNKIKQNSNKNTNKKVNKNTNKKVNKNTNKKETVVPPMTFEQAMIAIPVVQLGQPGMFSAFVR